MSERLSAAGFAVLDEGFLDMPEYALDPQSLLMETTWVCSWFARVLERANSLKDHAGVHGGRPSVFVADRSPFSAVCYGNKGHLLEPVIREHIEEVRGRGHGRGGEGGGGGECMCGSVVRQWAGASGAAAVPLSNMFLCTRFDTQHF